MDFFNKRAYAFAGVMLVVLMATAGYQMYQTRVAKQIITPNGTMITAFGLILVALGAILMIFPRNVRPVRRIAIALVPIAIVPLLVVMHGPITKPDYPRIRREENVAALSSYTHYFVVGGCRPTGELPTGVTVVPQPTNECLVRVDVGRLSVTVYAPPQQGLNHAMPNDHTFEVWLNNQMTLWVYIYDHDQPQKAQPRNNPPSLQGWFVFTRRYWLAQEEKD